MQSMYCLVLSKLKKEKRLNSLLVKSYNILTTKEIREREYQLEIFVCLLYPFNNMVSKLRLDRSRNLPFL